MTLRHEICLRGQPTLRRYLDFVKHTVVGGDDISPKLLADEWRKANDLYHDLEIREAGLADGAECRPLTAAQRKLLGKVRADPRFSNTFDTMPTEFAMVELDKLVLFQTRVDQEHIKELAARLSPSTGFGALVDLCFPSTSPTAKVDIQRVGARRYVFSTASTDLRFRNPILVEPENVKGIQSSGPLVGFAGVPISFGPNLFSVIRSGTRMLLHNGYHRACAMRAAGITHAPCIVQTVTRQDELEVAAKAEVAQSPDFYFRSQRPPLLKDFFDRRIRRVFDVRPMQHVIEVNFEVREFTFPA
jgi:hypothetical protein